MYKTIVALCCLLALPSTALASGPFIVDSSVKIRYASGKEQTLLSELAPLKHGAALPPPQQLKIGVYSCVYSVHSNGATQFGASLLCGSGRNGGTATFAFCDMYTIGDTDTSRMVILGRDKKDNFVELAQIVVKCRTTSEYQK